MNITVYLGSAYGNSPVYSDAVRQLGAWIGEEHHTLVYGGSDSGTMGILSSEVMKHGGKVIGIMPQFLVDRNRQDDSITELHIVKDMSERKAEMIRLGDAFIAMPGGPGTIEEISEIMSAIRLNILHKPCILCNLNGYYDDLKKMYQKMVKEGFLSEEEFRQYHFAGNLEEVKEIIENEQTCL